MKPYFESNYKKLGLLPVNAGTLPEVNAPQYKPYIKILYLPEGYTLTVDFKQYSTSSDSLFFINANQYLELTGAGSMHGYFIFYNRDFYCIQIHDSEVACDGLLFNNIYAMPMTVLPEKEQRIAADTFVRIEEELLSSESSREEMIRTYLKQLIIRSTRTWKQQQLGTLSAEPAAETEFFRHFSRLVDIHFREKHSVADYADLLAMAPKTLSKKFNRLQLGQPNDIIKDRILLEAKRLLAYSGKSIKEISYDLGYDDPAYFNRLFSGKTGNTPVAFRKQFAASE
jgi:AraC-like DNA-binding protein